MLAKKFPKMNFMINFPGIGAGRLSKDEEILEVTKIIKKHLSLPNIFIYKKKKK